MEASAGNNGVFPITLITAGEGSTGIYSNEMLKENASAFNSGTKSFIDHPENPDKPWERSLTRIAGKLTEDARYEENNGVGSLKSSLKVDSRWIDFVQEYKDVIGLSIFIGAFGEKDSATGKTVVESFDADDKYKSVDLVVAAGRGGRFDMAMESYRTIENSLGESGENGSGNPAEPHNHSKDQFNMELEELANKFDSLGVVVEGLVSSMASLVDSVAIVQESLKPVEPVEVDEAEVVESLIESGLTKRSRKAVLEAVRDGAAVEDAIKNQKAVEDEFRTELRVQEGYVSGDGSFNGEVTDLGKAFG